MRALNRWTPWFGLHNSDPERAKHCKAIRSLQQDDAAWCEFRFLYDNLSILDSKSASLLQFNSVILAVVAIVFAVTAAWGIRCLLLGVMVCGISSCLLCLLVVWVHWSTTENLSDRVGHGVLLLQVRDRRTKLYRFAWWLAVLALSGLAVGALLLACR